MGKTNHKRNSIRNTFSRIGNGDNIFTRISDGAKRMYAKAKELTPKFRQGNVGTIEVGLGILKPEILMTSFLRMKLLNWIFILLTIVKAYYIAWDFMHIRDERSGLKNSIVLPLVILIPYLIFILILLGYFFAGL